jgi:tRNA threonylcarbamoyladenosine biosynthesis protein TsaE
MAKVVSNIDALKSFTLDGLERVATDIIKTAHGLNVWIFIGEMGVGKTTLIKTIAKQMGVIETVQSPTFSIVNEYSYGAGKIYHFDFYRIKNEEEAFDIGVDEYLESDEFCFVEWPDKITSLLPDHYFEVTISRLNNETRTIAFKRHE